MDLETGLVYVGVVVFSAAVILLVSMFGIKEKSYEEAIAEQRKLPDDLLFGKKEKSKEKKYKNKTGKKVKEKKEEKEEKEEKPEHVQFEEVPQILPPEPPISHESGKANKKKSKIEKVKPILVNKDEPVVVASELNTSQPVTAESNHFDLIHPKDEFELIRSHSKENINQLNQSEPIVNKSPKNTPTKSKKNHKESQKKDEGKEKEESKESDVNMVHHHPVKEAKEQQHHEVHKDVKDGVKENVVSNRDTKKAKKKNNILAQIGGDTDGINVSLLMPLVQKAELSRSEIQILIDQLLNKQLDNPMEYSEWTEGRADPVLKLKKQLAEKEKALADEHEASTAFQSKLKELRAELNSERSRLTASVRQLEESLNGKIMEVQTLHTRMQHILESHAAEKQGFSRQIEQLQAKINDDAAIIHKMQEDQGQTQGHMQQEMLTQRKQLEVQFAQMRENENALKAQLAQKHAEVQELQNVNVSVSQELQATCESSNAEIEMLRQQLALMQEQLMHSEGQLQHFKEANDRLQDLVRQLEESHRAQSDMEHRLKSVHRHEQELQKQVTSLQNELTAVKTEANESSSLKAELSNIQSELVQLRSELSASHNEAKSKSVEITTLKNLLQSKEEELKNLFLELHKSQAEAKEVNAELTKVIAELKQEKSVLIKSQDDYKEAQNHIGELKDELRTVQIELSRTQEEFSKINLIVESQKQAQSEAKDVSTKLLLSEGRENGIEEKTENINIQLTEYANTIAKKEDELSVLKADLTHKEMEINRLNSQIEILRCDVNNKNSLARRLQDDLEAQRVKNNELRTKNWKVMEALSAAENHAKCNRGKDIREEIQRIKDEEHAATKALLLRIFPSIKVHEKFYDEWVNGFVEKARTLLAQLQEEKENIGDNTSQLEEQNRNLQALVSHYKRIIEETEGMLNKLQNHVELEEARWQSQLRQKENEISNLRNKLVEEEAVLNESNSMSEAECET